MVSNRIIVLMMLTLSFLTACTIGANDKLSLCIWGTDIPPTTSLTGCDELWHRAAGCICIQSPGSAP